MVDPWLRQFSFAFDLNPGQRGFGDVENPAIIDGLVPYISPEDDQVRFGIGQGMPVPLPRSPILDVDDVPNAYSLFDVQMKEVI